MLSEAAGARPPVEEDASAAPVLVVFGAPPVDEDATAAPVDVVAFTPVEEET
jgi:hypothetical protein